MSEVIISPIFYMGNKRKLINKGLIELFPKDINTFYDLFAGSGIVSMNMGGVKRYVLNDINQNLTQFYDIFADYTAEEIISRILNTIKQYGMKRVGVNQKSPEAKEYKERYINLRNYANTTGEPIDIYTCMFYAFSQQMRFNNKGQFNMPFGNGAFTEENEEYIRNGCNFFGSDKVEYHTGMYRELLPENMNKNDFVYLDPPYINTTATYNENNGWTEKDDKELFEYCERLDSFGIRFALSNVFENKGIKNKNLIKWCEDNDWHVYTFDKFTYSACGKGNSNAKEVLITNY